MKRKNLKIPIIAFFLLFSILGFITSVRGILLVTSRTYTLDTDFDEGELIGVEYYTVPDQLQLSEEYVTLPFIWVPNNEGTVSKVNTETGEELGRYWVAPYSGSPSRTTVDLDGNCWVGNRDAGTVVKIGLYEYGVYIDRNGNGVCDTSTDSTPLPWGEDECVLFEVVLIQGNEGTYTPGLYDPLTNPEAYPGPYDVNHWGTSPRGLAVDENNNLWASTYNPCYYYYINGETGAIDFSKTVYLPGHYAYGAVMDENQILWSTNRPTGTPVTPHILRLNTTDLTFEKIVWGTYLPYPSIPWYILDYKSYGLALDHLGHIFASAWTDTALHRLNISRPLGASFPISPEEFTVNYKPLVDSARGVACTSDNNIWVASTSQNSVYRFDNDGILLKRIYLDTLGYPGINRQPTGVAVDAADKVWVVNNNLDLESIIRIDPTGGEDELGIVELEIQLEGSNGHYGYSDMTGIQARTITTKIGTWTTVFDSGKDDMLWGKVSWNSEEPEGTSIEVNVRSSNNKNDPGSWSSWEEATDGVWLSSIPNGRYLQIQTTLQSEEDELSPILYDLTVHTKIPTTIDFNPDTLNQKSNGKWVTVYIEFPSEYDVNDIDVSSLLLNAVIPAEDHPTRIGDKDGDNIPDLMVKFNRSAVIDLLDPNEMVCIIITGELLDGTPLIGTDVIRVIH